MPHAYIIFDSECGLCSRAIRFVLKRDTAGYFLFVPITSRAASELFLTHGVQDAIEKNTVFLIEEGKVYMRSDAALRVMQKLSGPVRLLFIGNILPRFIRDAIYRLVAHNRIRFFGRKNVCEPLGDEYTSRLIESLSVGPRPVNLAV